MGGPQKGQRFGGRKKGTPNKATTERRLLAVEVERRRMARSVGQERELSKERIERYIKHAEGAAAMYRPTSPQEIAAGQPKNPMGDANEHREWVRLAATFSKWLLEFEIPKLSAVALALPPPVQRDEPKRFTLTVFEGGKPLPRPGEIIPKDEIAS
jgi:hypothetical protein